MAPIRSVLLFSALTLICLALLQVSDGRVVRLKCRCLDIAPCPYPRAVKEIQIIPQTAMCHRTEVVVIKKNGESVCLHPSRQCTHKIIQALTKETTKPMER